MFLVYRSPYDEYMTPIYDGSSFAAQIYNIVVVRQLRPTLVQRLKDKEPNLVGIFSSSFLI